MSSPLINFNPFVTMYAADESGMFIQAPFIKNKDELIKQLKAFSHGIKLRRSVEREGAKVVSQINPHFTCLYENLAPPQSYLLGFILENYVSNGGTHPTLSKILEEYATDDFLIILADVLRKNKDIYPDMAIILSPLTKRFLKIHSDAAGAWCLRDTVRGIIFSGNQEVERNEILGDFRPSYSVSKTNNYLSKGEFGLARLIYQIHLKACSLDARGSERAYQVANKLYESLSDEYLTYLSATENTSAALTTFKMSATQNIEDAQNELGTHRGWKNLLANIGLHIGLLVTTAGLGNLAALGYSYYSGNKNLLFSLTETDSMKRTTDLSSYIAKFTLS